MSDEKKTPGLTRRGLVGGALGIAAGVVAAKVADMATEQSQQSAYADAHIKRISRLTAALRKETGYDWTVMDGVVSLTKSKDNLSHKQELYFVSDQMVAYTLTTTRTDKQKVTVDIHDVKGKLILSPDGARALDPEDRRNIEFLMEARGNVHTIKKQMHRHAYFDELEKLIPGLPVSMSAKVHDDGITYWTRAEGNTVPMRYVFIDYGRLQWIAEPYKNVDHGYIRRDGTVSGSKDHRLSYDWDHTVGTKRQVPEVTGEPSGDLRPHMQKLAAVMYEHGGLKVEQKPGWVTQGVNKVREWMP